MSRHVRLVAYVRVSTADQDLGLAAQRTAINRWVKDRKPNYEVVEVYDDEAQSGASADRPGLRAALAALADGRADGLIVAKLDRLSRSLAHLSAVLELFDKRGWDLFILDPAVNSKTPYGKAFLSIGGVFAQLERDLISQRTKEALAVLRAEGKRFSRYPPTDDKTLLLLKQMRGRGMSTPAIARRLMERGIPSPSGGHRWHPGTIGKVLAREGFVAKNSPADRAS